MRNFRKSNLQGLEFDTTPQGIRKYIGLGAMVGGGFMLAQKDTSRIVAGILIVGGGFMYFIPDPK